MQQYHGCWACLSEKSAKKNDLACFGFKKDKLTGGLRCGTTDYSKKSSETQLRTINQKSALRLKQEINNCSKF